LKITAIRLAGDAMARSPEKTVYAFSHRGDVPDAYFDSEGELLFSISGILDFDSENDPERRIATDSLSMAGISERKAEGTIRWFRRSDAAETEIPAFSDEAFELWNEAAFFESRLDLLRRLRYLQNGNTLPPIDGRTVSELVRTGSVTLPEFVELRRLRAVDEKTFAEHRKTLSKSLPKQLSDQKFDRALKIRHANAPASKIVHPVAHRIGSTEITRLRNAGHLEPKDAENVLERLRILEEFNAAVGKAAEDAMRKRQGLREGISTGAPIEKKGR
jgi:hypothetical protein